MQPLTVIAVLAGLVALATVLGLLWQRGQGRVRKADGSVVVRAEDLPGVAGLARGATLLQFSTEVCAPCKATHRVLDEVASGYDGVEHLDIDLTHRPELAARFSVLQTPTTLILDRRGVVRARIGGALKRDTVTSELDSILEAA